jgi:hypothetical protein
MQRGPGRLDSSKRRAVLLRSRCGGQRGPVITEDEELWRRKDSPAWRSWGHGEGDGTGLWARRQGNVRCNEGSRGQLKDAGRDSRRACSVRRSRP